MLFFEEEFLELDLIDIQVIQLLSLLVALWHLQGVIELLTLVFALVKGFTHMIQLVPFLW